MKIERSKEWWMKKADSEGDSPIGAGMLAPVDEELDTVLVEMAEACIAGNLSATADAVRKAHARLFAAVAEEREACAKVADAKALEHVELARQFTKTKQHVGAKAHEWFALVCNGSDGVAARIRGR